MSLHRSTPRMEPDPRLLAFVNERPDVPAAVRERAVFFVFFAQTIYPKLEEQRLALDALYCPTNGRPADDPVCLLGVLLLQFVERLPDRQAAEAVCYDTRWRLALHLSENDGGFDPSLLPRFRQRLLTGQRERIAFDAILDLLVDHGWLPRRSRQRLDSTHVCGLLSAMSRLGCVRETLRLALEELERHDSLPEFCCPFWKCYVESKLDPRISLEVVKAKTQEAGKDAQVLLAWSRQQGPAIDQRPQMQLLARVFAENFEIDETGACSVTRAQPAGAVHNPHEPEAQWSSKSTTRDKSWTGYKAQVAETVQEEPRLPGEPTRSIITAVVTQNATESDQTGMAQVFREQAEQGLEPPDVLYVDGAYVYAEGLHEAQAQGRELRGPARPAPKVGRALPVDQFDVHVEDRKAICPAGQTSSQCSRVQEDKAGHTIYRMEWNKSVCQACPLRDRCLGERQTHRIIEVGQYHTLLQARRREMQTEAFKKDMHHRNGIEGPQSELVRAYGLRRARYRGLAKVRLQNYFIGAACNIRRWSRRLVWEIQQGLRSAGAITATVTG
jgi:transposase